jgi:hypothetical protein
MNDLNKYETCPNCDELKFITIDEHPWIHFDKNGIPLTEYHHHRKCINCGYEHDQCNEQKDKILFAAANEPFEDNIINASQCDRLNKNSTVQIARIYLTLRTKKWLNAIERINEFESNEANRPLTVDYSTNLKILICICYYFLGQIKKSKKIISGLTPNFLAHEKSNEFTFQIISMLNREISNQEYEEFKSKWFTNNAVPFGVFSISGELLFIMSNSDKIFLELPFAIEIMFTQITFPLFEKLILKKVDRSKWPNSEVEFLEHMTKMFVPIEENDNADAYWFRELKSCVNTLSFDILFTQEKFNEAFHYIETIGVDYINPRRDVPTVDLSDEDLFEISIEAFPYYPDPNIWLGCQDVHDACWQNFYQEIWAEVLRYLTIMKFYENQLSNYISQPEKEYIKDRILLVTNRYEDNGYLKREILHWKFPKIVANIYAERKDWQNAFEYLKLANLPEGQKSELLKHYNVDNELFEEIACLLEHDQREVLAFVRIIFRLERLLREYIRIVSKKNNLDLDSYVNSILNNRNYNRQGYDTIFPTQNGNEILDKLTFSELFDLIVNPEIWQFFSAGRLIQEEWKTARGILGNIRIKLAHSKSLSGSELIYSLDLAKKIIDNIKKKY